MPATLAGTERDAAWGEPPRPGFPLGGNGKGGLGSLLPQADFRFAFRIFSVSSTRAALLYAL